MTLHFPRIRTETVTTTPQKFVRRNLKRKSLLIVNTDTSTVVYLVSSSHAIYSDGIPIPTNYGHYRNKDCPQGAYFLVVASGTADVRIEEDIEG